MKKPSNCISCGKPNRQAGHLFCSLDCQKSDKKRVIYPKKMKLTDYMVSLYLSRR